MAQSRLQGRQAAEHRDSQRMVSTRNASGSSFRPRLQLSTVFSLITVLFGHRSIAIAYTPRRWISVVVTLEVAWSLKGALGARWCMFHVPMYLLLPTTLWRGSIDQCPAAAFPAFLGPFPPKLQQASLSFHVLIMEAQQMFQTRLLEKTFTSPCAELTIILLLSLPFP